MPRRGVRGSCSWPSSLRVEFDPCPRPSKAETKVSFGRGGACAGERAWVLEESSRERVPSWGLWAQCLPTEGVFWGRVLSGALWMGFCHCGLETGRHGLPSARQAAASWHLQVLGPWGPQARGHWSWASPGFGALLCPSSLVAIRGTESALFGTPAKPELAVSYVGKVRARRGCGRGSFRPGSCCLARIHPTSAIGPSPSSGRVASAARSWGSGHAVTQAAQCSHDHQLRHLPGTSAVLASPRRAQSRGVGHVTVPPAASFTPSAAGSGRPLLSHPAPRPCWTSGWASWPSLSHRPGSGVQCPAAADSHGLSQAVGSWAACGTPAPLRQAHPVPT